MNKLTAEEFLREKLESEISSFGDGVTEFHTRDIAHLLECLDEKDQLIAQYKMDCAQLIDKMSWDAEKQFDELLDVCMTINNLSAEQRLNYIRQHYKALYEKRCTNKKN